MSDDARLSVVLDADINRLIAKLDKANTSVHASSTKIQRDLDDANGKWERMFLGEGPGKAIEQVFSSSRLAVLEAGTEKIRIFGSAVEALGPLGIAAAAGLAIFSVAGENARKALEWADEVDRFSKSVGTSAESLQTFDDANIASSVGVERGRAGLESFTDVFAKYQAHIGDKKSTKWFDAVGLARSDVAGVTDSVAALQIVLTKVAALGNPSNRIGALNAFGLGDFKNVVADGEEGVQKYAAALKDAQSAGGIVSNEDIARAAELNDHVEELAHRIGQDFKKLFLELGPEVDAVAGFLRDVSAAITSIVGQLPAAAAGFRAYAAELLAATGAQRAIDIYAHPIKAIGDRNQASVKTASDGVYNTLHDGSHPVLARLNDAFANSLNYDFQNAPGDIYKSLTAKGHQVAPATDPVNKPVRASANTIPPPARVFGTDKEPKGPKDHADEIEKTSLAAIAAATKEELTARQALATTLEEQHAIRLQLLESEKKGKDDQLAAELKLKKITPEAAAKATSLNDTAFQEKIDLENRQYALAVADQARAYADDLRKSQAAHLVAQASIANTAEQAAAYEKQAFDLSQQSALVDFNATIDKALVSTGRDHLTAEQARTRRAQFAQQQEDETAQNIADSDRKVRDAKQAFADQLSSYVSATLQSEIALADTTAQRTAIDRKLLDIKQAQERRALENDITDRHRSPADAAAARSGLAAQQGAENRAFDVQHLSPFAAFSEEGRKAAADVGQALQTEAVKGITDFNDGIADAIVNGRNLGDVMHGVFASLEADLVHYLLKQAEIGILGSLTSALGGGGINFGHSGVDLGIANPLANGVPSDFFPKKFADGGLVTGAGGPRSDTIPALLSPGEFVLSNNMLSGLRGLSPSAMRSGSANISIAYAPSYNVQGSGPELDRLRTEMAQDRASFAGRASAAVQDGLRRGQITTRRA